LFDWLKRNRRGKEMPEYSAIRKIPSRGLPRNLTELEAGKAHVDRRDEIENSLLELHKTKKAQSPSFVEILDIKHHGLLTITLPETSSLCLPVFSSPFRAGDYVRTIVDSGSPVNYLSSSSGQLIAMLRELRGLGIDQFVLDRCPRCNTFCAIHSESVSSVDDVITCWSISRATELARLELYLNYAQRCVDHSELVNARDVLLEIAAHVGLEDRRLHLLLGQVAVALDDRELLRESKAFLQFFQFESLEGDVR
jgi:hypothetical protein